MSGRRACGNWLRRKEGRQDKSSSFKVRAQSYWILQSDFGIGKPKRHQRILPDRRSAPGPKAV